MRHRPCVIALSNAAAAPMGGRRCQRSGTEARGGPTEAARQTVPVVALAEVRGMCSSWLTWTGSTAIRRTSELIITAATFCQRDIVLLHRACKPPHVYEDSRGKNDPFQLHRRPHSLRRPFYQRDIIAAERDAIAAERDTIAAERRYDCCRTRHSERIDAANGSCVRRGGESHLTSHLNNPYLNVTSHLTHPYLIQILKSATEAHIPARDTVAGRCISRPDWPPRFGEQCNVRSGELGPIWGANCERASRRSGRTGGWR